MVDTHMIDFLVVSTMRVLLPDFFDTGGGESAGVNTYMSEVGDEAGTGNRLAPGMNCTLPLKGVTTGTPP